MARYGAIADLLRGEQLRMEFFEEGGGLFFLWVETEQDSRSYYRRLLRAYGRSQQDTLVRYGRLAMPAKTKTSSDGFSADERAAMKQRVAELRAKGKKGAKKADALQAVLDSIALMAPDDRAIAERLHATVTSTARDFAEDLVRDARLRRRRWQGRGVLQGRRQVQESLLRPRLRRGREPRPR